MRKNLLTLKPNLIELIFLASIKTAWQPVEMGCGDSLIEESVTKHGRCGDDSGEPDKPQGDPLVDEL
jgi:hypothetical protein